MSIRFITAFPILPVDKMLDRKDLALINVLRENARMPVSAIAKKLGIGRATVKQRMEKLEKDHAATGAGPSRLMDRSASPYLETRP